MYNHDARYASSRLYDTLIRNDEGKVIHVLSVKTRKGVPTVFWLDGLGKEGMTPLHKCNVKPIPLGYTEVGGDLVYLARQPMRRCWRQGLRKHNLALKTRYTHKIKSTAHLREVVQILLLQKYDDLQTIVTNFQKKAANYLISPSFALDKEGILWYKGEKVGKLWENWFKFDRKFMYLQGRLVREAH